MAGPCRRGASGQMGLVSVDVPPGEHELALRFGPTPDRAVGAVLATLAVVVWAYLAWRGRLPGTRVSAAVLLLAAIALDANGTGLGQSAPRPHPVSVGVQDLASLVAYDTAMVPGGHELAVTLDWLALRNSQANDKAFVHLVGPGGQVVAQDDGDPVGGFTPTSRWEPGELIEDCHYVALPADLQAGNYRLKAGLYEFDPLSGQVRNLPTRPPSADGRVDLGEITLR